MDTIAYPIISGPPTKALQRVKRGAAQNMKLTFEVLVVNAKQQRNGKSPETLKFSCSPSDPNFKIELKDQNRDGYIWFIDVPHATPGFVAIRYNSSMTDGMLILNP